MLGPASSCKALQWLPLQAARHARHGRLPLLQIAAIAECRRGPCGLQLEVPLIMGLSLLGR
jgi:hypothetical protein